MEEGESIRQEVLPSGDVYIGKFDGLLPQGTGIYTWLDGTAYDGEWDKSKMSGRGCIRWPSGAAYEGEISGGFLHGSGVYTSSIGSKYEGDWRMNIQHGFGSKIYCNSDIYEGSWREGLQEGMGRYVWNSGNIYVGNWNSGKMCGKGLMKWANGDQFDGFWLDGLQHGCGYYEFADGSYYVGTWSKGLKDGKGMFYPSGCKHPFLKQLNDPSELCNQLDNCESHAKFTSASTFKIGSPTPESNMWLKDPLVGLMRRSGRQSHAKFTSANTFKIGDPTPESNMWLKGPLVGLMRRSGRISHRSGTIDGGWLLDGLLGDSSQQVTLKRSSFGDKDFLAYEREYAQGVLITEKAVHSDCEDPEQNKLKLKCLLEKPGKPCKTIIEGDRSFYLMLNLQLGIRYTVGKITPVPKREVRTSDFGPLARIRMYFPSQGSEFTPPHHSIGFTWKDYCPMIFRNLREMFKIDAADYMVSVCGTDGLKELSSPGKSGSIFYLSQDERFMLKTLKKSELKILLKMLPRYYGHVSEHENTLITKFFGLHRITLKGGRKVRFVVMGNMFCTELRIHRRYDLKGSSQGRSTKKCKIDENTTQKDLDLSYVFLLEKSWREALFKQIYLDCKFLESQHIIDYSLLLGLHFRAPQHSKDLSKIQNLQQKHAGLSTNHDETIPWKGLRLVTHDPGSVNMMPGSHIRGSTLRASAIGGEEADLLLPDTGRLRVQLGVNMPAQANPKELHEASPQLLESSLCEIYDVVLYFGIIDVLQEYNMTKKVEHAMKSLKFDPLSISAVKPSLYSTRFIRFLEKVFPEQL